jgi:hypothetical protein
LSRCSDRRSHGYDRSLELELEVAISTVVAISLLEEVAERSIVEER